VETKEFVSLTGAKEIDRLFHEDNSSNRGDWIDFVFNEEVVNVFPNMISRSVPRYWEVNQETAVWARKFYQEGSNIYDLGASLGAVSWEIAQRFLPEKPPIVAIEQSSAMVQQFQSNLEASDIRNIQIIEEDICNAQIQNASVIVCNYTLQFICTRQRKELLSKIYSALRPKGVLLLAEKVALEDEQSNQKMRQLHHEWKMAQGYSLTEIEEKSRAIANVMPVDAISTHEKRFKEIGFSSVVRWSQKYNFVAWVAQK